MNDPIAQTDSSKESRRIINAIKERDVHMRPRRYFMLRAALIAVAAFLLFLILLYMVSFIIYALHEDGAWFAADYGISGWSLLLGAIPWGLLIFAFILLLLLANLLRHYTFVSHQPLFYLLFAFIVIITLGGFFLAATALHPDLSQYSAANVPFLGNFYEYETAFPASVHRGVITSFTDGGFTITDDVGITSSVVAATGVVFIQDFHVGDVVLVFGTRNASGTISAFGIQRIGIATSTPTSSAPASPVLP